MKVLLTGAGGQVGRALIDTAPADIRIIACSRQDLDIASARSVQSCVRHHRPDVIVNAAAYTAVDRAESEPETARRINTDGPRHLAAAASAERARLIHISTDFVFDGTSSVPYAPGAATNPLGVYGLTKRDGELAVLRALPTASVVVRTAWVYAASGRNFVETMLRLMRAGQQLRVVADQVGTPTSARSLAQTIWKIIGNPEVHGVHHWTDAGVASWYDFGVAIAEEGASLGLLAPGVSVTPITTREYPTPACRPRFSVLDKSSLLALGIAAVHWRERLRSVLGEIRNA